MLRADFPGRLNQTRKNWESPRMEVGGGLLSRIKLGCSLGGEAACADGAVKTCITCVRIVRVCRGCVRGSSTTSCRRPRPPWVSWTLTPVALWTCSCPWLSRTGGGEHLSRTVVFPCVHSARGRALWWVSPPPCALSQGAKEDAVQCCLQQPSRRALSSVKWSEQVQKAGTEKEVVRLEHQEAECLNCSKMTQELPFVRD